MSVDTTNLFDFLALDVEDGSSSSDEYEDLRAAGGKCPVLGCWTYTGGHLCEDHLRETIEEIGRLRAHPRGDTL
jgi:hypothetical protein